MNIETLTSQNSSEQLQKLEVLPNLSMVRQQDAEKIRKMDKENILMLNLLADTPKQARKYIRIYKENRGSLKTAASQETGFFEKKGVNIDRRHFVGGVAALAAFTTVAGVTDIVKTSMEESKMNKDAHTVLEKKGIHQPDPIARATAWQIHNENPEITKQRDPEKVKKALEAEAQGAEYDKALQDHKEDYIKEHGSFTLKGIRGASKTALGIAAGTVASLHLFLSRRSSIMDEAKKE